MAKTDKMHFLLHFFAEKFGGIKKQAYLCNAKAIKPVPLQKERNTAKAKVR